MWSDNETAVDLLSVKHLVGAVTGTICNDRVLPATIGIFGDWGSGKSSLVKMVTKEFEGKDDVLCLTFNGWLFEDYEDAKAALMGTIIDEIKEKRELTAKAKELIKNLIKRVDWFRLAFLMTKHAVTYMLAGTEGNFFLSATDLVGAAKGIPDKVRNLKPTDVKGIKEKIEATKVEDVQGFTKDLSNSESVRKNIRDFRKDFEELLKQTKIKTLVVFIDDLDRCLPDTVIETLEAIRLFLFVPGTAFVVSADEKLVEQAVERKFPDPSGRGELSRNYLEKLIQFPIRIPSLGRSEVKTYMNLLFAELRLKSGFDALIAKVPTAGAGGLWDIVVDLAWFEKNLSAIPQELSEDLLMTQQIGDVLAETLYGNPRQVKRFLNTLLIRMGMAESRGLSLKKRILAKLMVLEYKRPTDFKTLAQRQAQEEGKSKDLRLLEDRAAGVMSLRSTTKPNADQKDSITAQELVSSEFGFWLEDKWLLNWLKLEPKLGGEDLRPYFHVSRDKIGTLLGPIIQLSNDAQSVLGLLISDSEAQRVKGFEKIKELSQDDAVNVLEVLGERTLASETTETVSVIIKAAEAQPLLINKAVSILRNVPESRISLGIPIQVVHLKKLSTGGIHLIDQLLQKWSESVENHALQQATANALKRK